MWYIHTMEYNSAIGMLQYSSMLHYGWTLKIRCQVKEASHQTSHVTRFQLEPMASTAQASWPLNANCMIQMLGVCSFLFCLSLSLLLQKWMEDPRQNLDTPFNHKAHLTLASSVGTRKELVPLQRPRPCFTTPISFQLFCWLWKAFVKAKLS